MKRRYILCAPDNDGNIELLNSRFDYLNTMHVSLLIPLLSTRQLIKLNLFLKENHDFLNLTIKEIF